MIYRHLGLPLIPCPYFFITLIISYFGLNVSFVYTSGNFLLYKLTLLLDLLGCNVLLVRSNSSRIWIFYCKILNG
ncbi:hypothetical protein LguiA_014877 [Lonicera macranthoides]